MCSFISRVAKVRLFSYRQTVTPSTPPTGQGLMDSVVHQGLGSLSSPTCTKIDATLEVKTISKINSIFKCRIVTFKLFFFHLGILIFPPSSYCVLLPFRIITLFLQILRIYEHVYNMPPFLYHGN